LKTSEKQWESLKKSFISLDSDGVICHIRFEKVTGEGTRISASRRF